jgi:NDP-sugar pyrophosphorylase family protein
LAAGLGKRLEPISDLLAKPAFPLAGRTPIVELWVRKFVDAGLSGLAMNLHRVPESIRGHFGDGKRFLADITYVDEGTPTGTLGGAIKMVRALQRQGFSPSRVFIPSGDIVSTVNLQQLEMMMEFHVRQGAAVTMMLAPIPWDRRGDFGTVVLDGIAAGQLVSPGTYARVLDFREKDPRSPSNENNASNYLVETSFLLELEPYLTAADPDLESPCYDFGKHVFMGMKGQASHLGFLTRYSDVLFGFEPGSLWFDVGNKRDYLEVNKAVLNQHIPLNIAYKEYPWGWMGEEVEMDLNRVTIRPPVIIGDGCTILPGAEIGPNVVLGDGWTCHRRSKIKEAVLWRHHPYADLDGDLTPRLNRLREVGQGVTVDTAIIVGGIISRDVRGETVDVLPDGTLNVRSLDWLPASVRA